MAAAAFDQALERIKPALDAHRFRLVGIDRGKAARDNSYAEYFRRDQRLRLVFEATERALWVEAAPQVGSEVVGRWRDVEWIVAGRELPLDTSLDDERLDRLVAAIEVLFSGKEVP